MGEKSIFGTLSTWWTRVAGRTLPDAPERRCEKGHLLDSHWQSCPYCDAEKRAREKTVQAGSDDQSNEFTQRSIDMVRNRTITPDEIPGQGRGATRFDLPPEPAPQAARSPVPGRKITGVVVTFSWKSYGEMFPIFEGRNVIGSGTVESEGGRPCDVWITTDPMLSNEHAVILCRAGRYELFDRQSTNGTFMNDEFVESQGVNLPDGAGIKTGSTVWTFRKILSPGDARPARDESAERQAPPSHQHGETIIR